MGRSPPAIWPVWFSPHVSQRDRRNLRNALCALAESLGISGSDPNPRPIWDPPPAPVASNASNVSGSSNSSTNGGRARVHVLSSFDTEHPDHEYYARYRAQNRHDRKAARRAAGSHAHAHPGGAGDASFDFDDDFDDDDSDINRHPTHAAAHTNAVRDYALVGPHCLHALIADVRALRERAHMSNSPLDWPELPSPDQPVFSHVLAGTEWTTTGLKARSAATAMRLLRWMGAKTFRSLMTSTTHLLATSSATTKYRSVAAAAAMADGWGSDVLGETATSSWPGQGQIRIVTNEYIRLCWQQHRRLRESDYTYPYLNQMVVVVSGFRGVERSRIERLVTMHGGTIPSSMSSKVDCLVAKEPRGRKFGFARQLQVPVVSVRWLDAFIETRGMAQMAPFTLVDESSGSGALGSGVPQSSASSASFNSLKLGGDARVLVGRTPATGQRPARDVRIDADAQLNATRPVPFSHPQRLSALSAARRSSNGNGNNDSTVDCNESGDVLATYPFSGLRFRLVGLHGDTADRMRQLITSAGGSTDGTAESSDYWVVAHGHTLGHRRSRNNRHAGDDTRRTAKTSATTTTSSTTSSTTAAAAAAAAAALRVSPQWVEWSAVAGELLDPNASVMFRPLPITLPSSLLDGACVSLSGISAPARNYYAALIKLLGGLYTDTFSRKNTHLVVAGPQGEKYKRACQRRRVDIVTAEWLDTCARQDRLVDAEPYSVDPMGGRTDFRTQRLSAPLRGCTVHVTARLLEPPHGSDNMAELHDAAKELGGDICLSLRKSVTHVVMRQLHTGQRGAHGGAVDGEMRFQLPMSVRQWLKQRTDSGLEAQVVAPDWLVDCSAHRRRLDESLYPPTLRPHPPPWSPGDRGMMRKRPHPSRFTVDVPGASSGAAPATSGEGRRQRRRAETGGDSFASGDKGRGESDYGGDYGVDFGWGDDGYGDNGDNGDGDIGDDSVGFGAMEADMQTLDDNGLASSRLPLINGRSRQHLPALARTSTTSLGADSINGGDTMGSSASTASAASSAATLAMSTTATAARDRIHRRDATLPKGVPVPKLRATRGLVPRVTTAAGSRGTAAVRRNNNSNNSNRVGTGGGGGPSLLDAARDGLAAQVAFEQRHGTRTRGSAGRSMSSTTNTRWMDPADERSLRRGLGSDGASGGPSDGPLPPSSIPTFSHVGYDPRPTGSNGQSSMARSGSNGAMPAPAPGSWPSQTQTQTPLQSQSQSHSQSQSQTQTPSQSQSQHSVMLPSRMGGYGDMYAGRGMGNYAGDFGDDGFGGGADVGNNLTSMNDADSSRVAAAQTPQDGDINHQQLQQHEADGKTEADRNLDDDDDDDNQEGRYTKESMVDELAGLLDDVSRHTSTDLRAHLRRQQRELVQSTLARRARAANSASLAANEQIDGSDNDKATGSSSRGRVQRRMTRSASRQSVKGTADESSESSTTSSKRGKVLRAGRDRSVEEGNSKIDQQDDAARKADEELEEARRERRRLCELQSRERALLLEALDADHSELESVINADHHVNEQERLRQLRSEFVAEQGHQSRASAMAVQQIAAADGSQENVAPRHDDTDYSHLNHGAGGGSGAVSSGAGSGAMVAFDMGDVMLRKSKPTVFVTLTGFKPTNGKRGVLTAAVQKLGGVMENAASDRTTHVIVAKPQRTLKIFGGMARGAWVLREEWVEQSMHEGRWVDETDFEWSSSLFKAVQEGSDLMRLADAGRYWRRKIRGSSLSAVKGQQHQQQRQQQQLYSSHGLMQSADADDKLSSLASTGSSAVPLAFSGWEVVFVMADIQTRESFARLVELGGGRVRWSISTCAELYDAPRGHHRDLNQATHVLVGEEVTTSVDRDAERVLRKVIARGARVHREEILTEHLLYCGSIPHNIESRNSVF